MHRLLFALLFCCTLSTISYAETIRQINLKDQWDIPLPLTTETQWIIYSHHKAGGEWTHNVLTKLNLVPLKQYQLVYVANISAMPGIISRMFALPKMRDYVFRIGLVEDAEHVEGWPKKENRITVMQLQSFNVKQVHYFADEIALERFISEHIARTQRPASEN
ncbi:MAG: hypothetical protein KC477_11595 [Oceanospirillaceae bacterium]|nr:hypothetical protein [Oceanospirillaceae bacterium]